MLNQKHFFLYLTKQDWVRPWTIGGKIPIGRASNYKAEERIGTKTPDEAFQRKLSGTGEEEFFNFFSVNSTDKQIRVTYKNEDGSVRREVAFDQTNNDGLILSFCTIMDKSIAMKLGKVACVKILDMDRLKYIIDQQVGITSKSGVCQYVRAITRDHFTKSVKDSWQKEFRLFWPTRKELWVDLPPGIGEEVNLDG